MTFNGWVAVRRGILEHTMTGALSMHECVVLLCLILLADKSTGRGRMNAPALRIYFPELSYDGAKRVLKSLEDKRYIWRQITPYSKAVYPYWVNRYVPSTGPNKDRQISLEEVFDSGDVKLIQFRPFVSEGALDPALGRALGPAPWGAPDVAPNNNKDKNKRQRQEQEQNPLTAKEVCAPPCDDSSITVNTVERTAKRKLEPGSAHDEAQPEPPFSFPRSESSETQSGVGLKWSGADQGYRDLATGRVVDWKEARKRIATLGFESFGTTFIDASGNEVPWEDAQRLISGTKLEEKAA